MYNEVNEEIIKPAKDVFEINDFTAATEWENFIDDIENVFRKWKICQTQSDVKELSRNDFLNFKWKCRKEKLEFYNFPFVLFHYKLDDAAGSEEVIDSDEDIRKDVMDQETNSTNQMNVDIMSCASDFCPVGPKSAILFGLREVLVLGPDTNTNDDVLGNDTRAKMVVGAVNIALHNTNTSIPCLVQVMDTKKNLFNGSWIFNNSRMEMTSVCLNKKPAHCNYLSGLLELFKNKINFPMPVVNASPARVSVRFSYELDEWAGYTWMIDPPDLDLFSISGDTDFIQLTKLPFGCIVDPISGLTLHTTWRDISEDLITDTQVHSDLDPLEAPEWSIEVSLVDKPDCLLAKHLDKCHQLCSDSRTMKMLLGDMAGSDAANDGENVSQLLDKMSGPRFSPSTYSLGKLQEYVRPMNKRTFDGGPLKPSLIQYVLGYLFPDSVEDSKMIYTGDGIHLPDTMMAYVDMYTGSAKTCPYDSLVWRLCHVIVCCLQWAGVKARVNYMFVSQRNIGKISNPVIYLPD